MPLVHIDRAAWQRIKARMAEPMVIGKGRSVGATVGALETWRGLFDVTPRHPNETDAELRERIVRRWHSITIDADGRPVEAPYIEAVMLGIEGRKSLGPASLRELSDTNERLIAGIRAPLNSQKP